MKLSISNIGWTAEKDVDMYKILAEKGFDGLEIAPTRLFPYQPYQYCNEAEVLSKKIKEMYNLEISSMQSIWYGKSERIVESPEAERELLSYTKCAIEFAHAIGCTNLVFGCPKNRAIDSLEDSKKVKNFLAKIADEAHKKKIIIALEANPTIYNTNFANSTQDAISIIDEVNHPALKLNLDFGTMLYNQEAMNVLEGKIQYINHIHISEPYLKPIQHRESHRILCNILHAEEYDKFISIEMGKPESHLQILEAMDYVKSIFGDV